MISERNERGSKKRKSEEPTVAVTYLNVVDDELLESVWAYVSGLGV